MAVWLGRALSRHRHLESERVHHVPGLCSFQRQTTAVCIPSTPGIPTIDGSFDIIWTSSPGILDLPLIRRALIRGIHRWNLDHYGITFFLWYRTGMLPEVHYKMASPTIVIRSEICYCPWTPRTTRLQPPLRLPMHSQVMPIDCTLLISDMIREQICLPLRFCGQDTATCKYMISVDEIVLISQ